MSSSRVKYYCLNTLCTIIIIMLINNNYVCACTQFEYYIHLNIMPILVNSNKP